MKTVVNSTSSKYHLKSCFGQRQFSFITIHTRVSCFTSHLWHHGRGRCGRVQRKSASNAPVWPPTDLERNTLLPLNLFYYNSPGFTLKQMLNIKSSHHAEKTFGILSKTFLKFKIYFNLNSLIPSLCGKSFIEFTWCDSAVSPVILWESEMNGFYFTFIQLIINNPFLTFH